MIRHVLAFAAVAVKVTLAPALLTDVGDAVRGGAASAIFVDADTVPPGPVTFNLNAYDLDEVEVFTGTVITFLRLPEPHESVAGRP